MCFTNGMIRKKHKLTEITSPLRSLSPICCLPSARLTRRLLLRVVYLTNCALGHVEKPKHLRAVIQADEQSRGALDSSQAHVKYAESESPPCQRGAEVSPVTRKRRTRLMDLRV